MDILKVLPKEQLKILSDDQINKLTEQIKTLSEDQIRTIMKINPNDRPTLKCMLFEYYTEKDPISRLKLLFLNLDYVSDYSSSFLRENNSNKKIIIEIIKLLSVHSDKQFYLIPKTFFIKSYNSKDPHNYHTEYKLYTKDDIKQIIGTLLPICKFYYDKYAEDVFNEAYNTDVWEKIIMQIEPDNVYILSRHKILTYAYFHGIVDMDKMIS
jgi:hypothetical protein